MSSPLRWRALTRPRNEALARVAATPPCVCLGAILGLRRRSGREVSSDARAPGLRRCRHRACSAAASTRAAPRVPVRPARGLKLARLWAQRWNRACVSGVASPSRIAGAKASSSPRRVVTTNANGSPRSKVTTCPGRVNFQFIVKGVDVQSVSIMPSSARFRPWAGSQARGQGGSIPAKSGTGRANSR